MSDEHSVRVDPAAYDLGAYAEKLRRESVEERERRERESFMAQIPRRFRGVKLAMADRRNDSIVAALDAVGYWIERVELGYAPMLALVGPPGLGKSMMLYAAAQHLYANERPPLLIRWWLFSDELRYGRGARDERDRPAQSAGDVRRQWHESTAPCLIDEFRFTSSTDHDATEMAKYALTAYDDEIPVMITGNSGKLVDLMGEAPADRFTVCTLEGESYR